MRAIAKAITGLAILVIIILAAPCSFAKVVLPAPMENVYYSAANYTTYGAPQINMTAEEVVSASPAEKAEIPCGINLDKTYEQCLKEAFERIYAEVNRLLERIPNPSPD